MAGAVARFYGTGGETAAVFAFPLAVGAIRLGVLGLYREKPGSLGPGALADVPECTDTALRLLLGSRAGTDDGTGPWARVDVCRSGPCRCTRSVPGEQKGTGAR